MERRLALPSLAVVRSVTVGTRGAKCGPLANTVGPFAGIRTLCRLSDCPSAGTPLSLQPHPGRLSRQLHPSSTQIRQPHAVGCYSCPPGATAYLDVRYITSLGPTGGPGLNRRQGCRRAVVPQWRASALADPAQLCLRGRPGRLVLTIAPGAARAPLVLLGSAIRADHNNPPISRESPAARSPAARSRVSGLAGTGFWTQGYRHRVIGTGLSARDCRYATADTRLPIRDCRCSVLDTGAIGPRRPTAYQPARSARRAPDQAALARRIRRRRSEDRSSSFRPPQVPYFSGLLTA
jgi:hypothetical protein